MRELAARIWRPRATDNEVAISSSLHIHSIVFLSIVMKDTVAPNEHGGNLDDKRKSLYEIASNIGKGVVYQAE